MTRSDTEASALPKCKFFDQLAFLHAKTAKMPTESNIPQLLFDTDATDALDECEPLCSQRAAFITLESRATPLSKRARVEAAETALVVSITEYDSLLKDFGECRR